MTDRRRVIASIPPLTDAEQERFWSKVLRGEGCWEWGAGHVSAGYGTFTFGGITYRAHRVAYTLARGPIPDGMTIDHLCRNRGCVNPDHLEPVTSRENTLRGVGPSAENARKTHCVHGHEFTIENTYVYGRFRFCRTCNRIRSRERVAA